MLQSISYTYPSYQEAYTSYHECFDVYTWVTLLGSFRFEVCFFSSLNYALKKKPNQITLLKLAWGLIHWFYVYKPTRRDTNYYIVHALALDWTFNWPFFFHWSTTACRAFCSSIQSTARSCNPAQATYQVINLLAQISFQFFPELICCSVHLCLKLLSNFLLVLDFNRISLSSVTRTAGRS